MSYFSDLSPYDYQPFRKQSHPKLLNIGWLDASYSYNHGPVDGALLEKLAQLCAKPVNRTRGYYWCPFCHVYPTTLKRPGQTLNLGDAEIRVPGRDGIVFACPTLICHYILDHGYRPPDEFLNALDLFDPQD